MTANNSPDYQFDDKTLTISNLDANEHIGNYNNPSSEHNFDYTFQTRRFQNIYKKDITLKSLHKKWSLID